MLLHEGKKFSFAKTGSVWRHEPTKDLDQEGLKLLDEVEFREGPISWLLKKFPKLALRNLLLLEGHDGSNSGRLSTYLTPFLKHL